MRLAWIILAAAFSGSCSGLCVASGLRAVRSSVVAHRDLMSWRAPTCVALDGAGDDSEEADESDPFMYELRQALSSLGEAEAAASDERVIDGFVDDRKDQVSAFEGELSRSLESVQESIESKLDSELRGVESDMMSRIDAAVAELRAKEASRDGADVPGGSAEDAWEGEAAELPDTACIAVCGASTRLGSQLLRALDSCGASFQLRALLADGEKLDKSIVPEACEEVPFAAFAPTALKKRLAGVDALVMVSSAAGGAGGVDAEVVSKLMKAVRDLPIRRVLFVSTHGVRCLPHANLLATRPRPRRQPPLTVASRRIRASLHAPSCEGQ